MKNKGIIITAIVFFLLINTTFFWEGKLGLFALPVFALLVVVGLVLAIVLLRQLYLAIREKFKLKQRLVVIGLLLSVLLLTYFWPLGIIDFDKLAGKDMLIAEREGGGNCYTKLKFKDDYSFKETNFCFGITEIKGTFRFVNDTIYFDNVELGRQVDWYYKFAVFKPSSFINEKVLGDLVRYKDLQDTIGHSLWITKNELQNLKDKGRGANKIVADR